ncbi:hypothetical protein [Pararobbsia alpina]|uniref:hypothetical protein n=1 Tax=Pararobbsia alpina TaxID=621374 RepID=UPI003CCDAE22
MFDRGADAAQAVKIIRRQVQQLSRLISDLLDAARISRGKLVIQRDTVPPLASHFQCCRCRRAAHLTTPHPPNCRASHRRSLRRLRPGPVRTNG